MDTIELCDLPPNARRANLMTKSNQGLSNLFARYQRMLSAKPARSEKDTQALLVEPVLTDLAGWCAEDIVRAEISDIIVREEGHQASRLLKRPRLVIEVKTFKPRDWLSWKYIGNGGAIKTPVSAKTRTFDLIRKNDSIGQLRVICYKLLLKKDYKPGYTIPVLTNGYWWLLFNSRSFVASKKLSQPIGAGGRQYSR